MRAVLPTTLATIAVLVTGVIHGVWTGRWAFAGAAPAAAAARLHEVPSAIGDWQGTDLDPDAPADGETAGSLYRRYAHRSTGQEIAVLLICGRPGPVSIHTPDVCYGASGFQVTAPERFEPPTGGAAFWNARMVRKKASEQTHLRVFWSWNAGAGWVASDNPRVHFARFPVLHKLYIVRELTHPDEPLEKEPCLDLMQQLLPELDKSLFPGS